MIIDRLIFISQFSFDLPTFALSVHMKSTFTFNSSVSSDRQQLHFIISEIVLISSFNNIDNRLFKVFYNRSHIFVHFLSRLCTCLRFSSSCFLPPSFSSSPWSALSSSEFDVHLYWLSIAQLFLMSALILPTSCPPCPCRLPAWHQLLASFFFIPLYPILPLRLFFRCQTTFLHPSSTFLFSTNDDFYFAKKGGSVLELLLNVIDFLADTSTLAVIFHKVILAS